MPSPFLRVPVELGSAVPYIQGVLANSRRTLSELLSQEVDLRDGDVSTWTLHGTPPPRTFEKGGLLPEPARDEWLHGEHSIAVPIPNTSVALVEEIAAFVRGTQPAICILGNELADANEPASSKYPSVYIYNEEVYHLVTSDHDLEAIAYIVKRARSIPVFVGVLSRTKFFAPSSNRLDLTFLQSAVRTAESIVVGAFDGEGYLLWTKRAPLLPVAQRSDLLVPD